MREQICSSISFDPDEHRILIKCRLCWSCPDQRSQTLRQQTWPEIHRSWTTCGMGIQQRSLHRLGCSAGSVDQWESGFYSFLAESWTRLWRWFCVIMIAEASYCCSHSVKKLDKKGLSKKYFKTLEGNAISSLNSMIVKTVLGREPRK